MGANDWKTLTAADYTPDMPPLNNPGSSNILNALPYTSSSYGPCASLQGYLSGTSLNARCQGACSYLDASDNPYIFAGDVNNLYKYTAASPNPVIVSNGTNPYTCAPDVQWRFSFFANRLLATDYESPIQSYVLGSSTNFAPLANGGITGLILAPGSGYTNGTYALTVTSATGSGFNGTVTVLGNILASFSITNTGKNYPQTATIAVPAAAGAGTGGMITPIIQTQAPNGYYLAVVKNFLCVGNTNDPTNGPQPQAVWWSADNDPTNWPTPGTALAAQYQSSYNNLYGEGGMIQGIVGNLGTSDGAVFMEHAVWRMVYSGPPNVFDFYPAEGVRGTPAPGSICQSGNLVYYLGEDGFYVFDGTSSQPIGINRVDRTFFNLLDRSNIRKISSAPDTVNRMIYWAFPGSGNSGGNPNFIIGYNWALDKWTQISPTYSSFVEYIFRGYTFGVNVLDNVGAVSLDSSQYNTYPMDSSVWNGGDVLLGGFLYNNPHQLGYFNGLPYTASIETTEQQFFPGRRAQVKNTRPLVDMFPMGNMAVNVAGRDTTAAFQQYNPGYTTVNYLGTAPQLQNGRYIRAQVQIDSSNGGSWTEFQGIEVEATQSSVM